MAGKAKTTAAKQKVEPGVPSGHETTLSETEVVGKFEQIEAAYTEERDLMNQLLGQIQMSQAIGKLTTVVGLTKLAHIKETKLYRAMAGKKLFDSEGNEITDVGTWSGFCRLIGSSQQKVDEDLMNLATFGEEALGNLNRIGAGYRELRKLRKLPDDVRQEIVQGQLVNLTDKDEVVALIDDLVGKHVQEKASLTNKLSDLKADAEAHEQIISDKNRKLDEQAKLIAKLQNKAGDWGPRAKEVCIETTRHTANGLEALDQLDAMRDIILNEDFGEDERDKAIEAMAVVYYDGLSQLMDRASELMAACEEVFIGYKERARPILQVFDGNGKFVESSGG